MNLLISMCIALSLTLVLELSFAMVCWGLRKKQLLLVLLMNLLTNPAVNLLHHVFWQIGWNTVLVVLLLEVAVVITEGFCCRGVIRRPWLFAVLVNGFSYSMGELLKLVL